MPESHIPSSILIAPLNWGLGHATRCVPLIERYLAEGHRVTIGGDGESLAWLRRRYPDLPYVELAPLRLRYSAGKSQTPAIVRQLPHILRWIVADHRRMNELRREQHFDRIISDNRFGLFAPTHPSSITNHHYYITHQLTIPLPCGWRWLEPLAQRVHAYIINRYSELWVPDYAESPGLAGRLSHPGRMDCYHLPIRYLGPLSRFGNCPSPIFGKGCPQDGKGACVLLLSGLEPQRSLFREQVLHDYPDVELIEGSIDDAYIARRLREADTIIARSGYSTIMDFAALGLWGENEDGKKRRIVLVPTPGQPEQEYLARCCQNRPLRCPS